MEYDLAEALELFLPGIIAGFGVGTIFWAIGYLISSAYAWIRKS